MKSLKDIIMLYHSISDESYEKLDQIMEVKEYKRKTELNNSNKFFILKKNDVLKENDKTYVTINSARMQLTLSAFGHNEKISNKIL